LDKISGRKQELPSGWTALQLLSAEASPMCIKQEVTLLSFLLLKYPDWWHFFASLQALLSYQKSAKTLIL